MLTSSCALAGSSNASTSSDTYEQKLHTALIGGVLTQEEYETKMRTRRDSKAPLAVATRPYGDGVVAKYNWLPAAGPFDTHPLAVKGARAFDHGEVEADSAEMARAHSAVSAEQVSETYQEKSTCIRGIAKLIFSILYV